MKIALFSKAFLPNVGGIETSTAMIALVWQAAGHDVEVITAVPDPDHRWSGPYPVRRRWDPPTLLGKARSADLVATNGYSRLAVGAALLARRPITIFHQGYQLICSDGLGFRDRTFHQFRMSRDLKLAFASAPTAGIRALARIPIDGAIRRWFSGARHVVPSHHVAGRLRLPGARVIYQPPNPVVIATVEELGPPSADGRRQAHLAGDIVFFGRLVFEKGCDVLLKAYALWRERGWPGLPAERSPPRLIIHGGGPEASAMKALVSELGLGDRVDLRPFLGGRDLVLAARDATVVVIPSVWEEPGATIAVELFACGVPVIASATGAQGEIFAEHGLVAGNGDVSGWADAFARHFAAGPKYPHPTGSEEWTLPVIRRSLLELLEEQRSRPSHA